MPLKYDKQDQQGKAASTLTSKAEHGKSQYYISSVGATLSTQIPSSFCIHILLDKDTNYLLKHLGFSNSAVEIPVNISSLRENVNFLDYFKTSVLIALCSVTINSMYINILDG
jgi:hypothetical protein